MNNSLQCQVSLDHVNIWKVFFTNITNSKPQNIYWTDLSKYNWSQLLQINAEAARNTSRWVLDKIINKILGLLTSYYMQSLRLEK